MFTASELGRLAARVKMAADPTFRRPDAVMPSVSGSSAPKPSVAPYAPNPKSGPGGGKENWDYEPKKPNAVSPKMPTSAPTPTPIPTPTSSNADETTSQRLKKLRESLSDTTISPAAKFEFDRAMKKIPEPAAPAAAPPATPPADNRPTVPPTSRRGNDWYETYRDNLSQKAQKLRQPINTDGFSNPTAEELAGYPSARLMENWLLENKDYDLKRFVRDPERDMHQEILDNTPKLRLDAARGTASNLLPNAPALLGGLTASAMGNPVAGAQIAARGASNIARNVYNMPTYLSPSKLKPTPQEIQELLSKKMQERLAENDRYHALEKFVEYPDQTKLQKLRELRAKHVPLPLKDLGGSGPQMRAPLPRGLARDLSPVPNIDRRGPGDANKHRTPNTADSLPPTDAPDGIRIGDYPFLDDKADRAKLFGDEFDLVRATTPHFPSTGGNGGFNRPYVHPDAFYTQNSNPDRVSWQQYVPKAYPEGFYNLILDKHKDGKYPTRAEREAERKSKEETIIHFPELADPNTAHGSSQRLRRMLYDPTDEGINPDVIFGTGPEDVLIRNDPAEIRYYANKAKMMRGQK